MARSKIFRSLGAERRGFAILSIVFVMVVFALLSIATVALLSTSSEMTMDEQLSQQAFHVADAGITYAAKSLSADPNWSDNAPFTKPFGPGSFTVSYTAQSAASATVRSDGTVQGITRSIEQRFTKGGGLATAFTKAFYTEGDIVATGSSIGTITGDVSAGGSVAGEGSGIEYSGETESGNSDAEIPQVDWNYWQGVATTVIGGNYMFPSGTYSGIHYISGNVGFNQDVTLNGTIVARGSVSFGGNSNIHITASPPNPAIIAEGSVTFAGTSDTTISGYIYTLSTITMTGTSDIQATGGMIAADDITLSGNTNATVAYASPGEIVPGFYGGEGSLPLGYGLWQEVY